MAEQVVKSPPKTERPQGNWPLEKLTQYIKDGLTLSRQLEKKSFDLGHRSAIHLFRSGMALWIVRNQMKATGDWMEWQEKNGLAVGTVNEAIRLYENAKTEKALKGLTVTDAKVQFKVIKRKVRKASESNKEPGDRKRYVIQVPTKDNAITVLTATLEIVESALAAAKEAVADADDEKRAEFGKLFEKWAELFKGHKTHKAGSKSQETVTNGRGT